MVEFKKISPETMARIHNPLADFEKMAPIGNLAWQTCIDEKVTMGEFQKRKMMPRPDSIETFLTIENGKMTGEAGQAANPDLTVKTPFEVWMNILTGKADGAQMLMEGKYSVSGQTDLLLNMTQFFGE